MSEPNAPVDVLFIVGSGRSGSTLLDRLLGRSPEVFSAGEVRRLWAGLEDGRRCSCGEDVTRCALWRSVLERAFGGVENVPRGLARAQRRVESGLFLPFMLLPVKPKALQRDLDALRDAYARLYAAIAAVTGAKAVVDSSKTPARGILVASLPGVRLRAVHIVRDCRAVAFSWLRGVASGHRMARHSSLRSAWWSWRSNLGAAFMRPFAADYVSVRYEDLAARPRETLRSITDRLSLAPAELVSEDTAELVDDHLLGGNPMRFHSGATRIAEDDEWKEKMSRRDILAVTLLTWPLLLKSRYPLLPAQRRDGDRPFD